MFYHNERILVVDYLTLVIRSWQFASSLVRSLSITKPEAPIICLIHSYKSIEITLASSYSKDTFSILTNTNVSYINNIEKSRFIFCVDLKTTMMVQQK